MAALYGASGDLFTTDGDYKNNSKTFVVSFLCNFKSNYLHSSEADTESPEK